MTLVALSSGTPQKQHGKNKRCAERQVRDGRGQSATRQIEKKLADEDRQAYLDHEAGEAVSHPPIVTRC